MNWTRRKFLMCSGVGPLAFLTGKKWGSISISSLPKKHTNQAKPDVWIELNMENLGWNLDKIRKKVSRPVLAVIKANAYGHGLIPTARYLEKSGIDSLMVCKLDEAIQLRKEGVTCPVLNFGPFFQESVGLLLEHQISQFVSATNVRTLNSTAASMDKIANIHIHVDTGMGRMGIPYNKAFSLISDIAMLKNLRIKGVSTTLTEDDEFDREQINRLLSICQ